MQNYAKGMLTIDNGEKRVDGNWFGKHQPHVREKKTEVSVN